MAANRRSLVVLTPEGEFVEVPGSPGEVGEEIGFALLRRTALHRRLLLTASAAAVLLLMAFALPRLSIFDEPKVAAYVAIDINPSVEIGVDKHRSVVELQALNPDGERVIEGVEYRKRPVGEVAADIIRNAEEAQYLRDGGEVFVTSMAAAGTAEHFEEELMQEIDQAVHAAAQRSVANEGTVTAGTVAEDPGSDYGSDSGSGSGSGSQAGSGAAADAPDATGPALRSNPDAASAQNIEVTIVRAPGELRETAQANGVSPGKMAVYLLAEKQGLPISLDDLKKGSIRQAVEPYGGISGLLGDGQSDEERKRELAELLAKEAVKAQNNSAGSGNGKAASANAGKKASADAGNKASPNAGEKDKQASRSNEKAGKAKKSVEKAEKVRQSAGQSAWQAAWKAEQAGGRNLREAVSNNRKPERQTPDWRQQRGAESSVRTSERQTFGRKLQQQEEQKRQQEQQKQWEQRKREQQKQPELKLRQEREKRQEQKHQEQQKQRQQEQKKQQAHKQQNRQDQKQQKQQEQNRQKQQEQYQQKRSSNDKYRSYGQNSRGRHDGAGERKAERQQDDRPGSRDVQMAGFMRSGADSAAYAGGEGPGPRRQ